MFEISISPLLGILHGGSQGCDKVISLHRCDIRGEGKTYTEQVETIKESGPASESTVRSHLLKDPSRSKSKWRTIGETAINSIIQIEMKWGEPRTERKTPNSSRECDPYQGKVNRLKQIPENRNGDMYIRGFLFLRSVPEAVISHLVIG